MIFDESNLPSGTIPYPVKQLEVKPFRAPQLQLLSKSIMLDDYQPAIEAMGQCVTNLDINELTTGDFFYLLVWQRLNALKRNPVMVNWECPSAIFVERDNPAAWHTPAAIQSMLADWNAADEEARANMRDPDKVMLDAEVCDAQNYEEVTFGDMSYVKLEQGTVLEPGLDYPRCRTLAEFIRLQRDPDFGMLAESAQWIKHPGTLTERIEMLSQQEDNDLFERACAANRDIKHGVLRTLLKACKRCGHKHPVTFTVDPQAFFL